MKIPFLFRKKSLGERTSVNVEKFNELLAAEADPQLLDVRTPAEFIDGYIPFSKNIDFHNKNFMEKISELNKELPVFLYCRSGGRSLKAARKMQKQGFKKIIDLKGGYLAWQNNKPD